MTLVGRFRRHRAFLPLAMLVALYLGVGLLSPVFFSLEVLLTLVTDTVTLFILASGITFVIMLGSIDLSGQAVAALSSVVVATLVGPAGGAAIPVAILAGMGFGLITGLVHVVFKLPSFIATLAMGSVASSAALLLSNMQSVPIPPDLRQSVFGWIVGESFGIPHQIFVGLGVLLLCLYLERSTRFGYWSRAIGAGEPAARAIGVPVRRVKVIALVLSGGFAALVGVMLAARLASGSPTVANEFLLPAIAAVVVGGTAITGGVGTVAYTLVGALVISVVRVGMTFIGVNIFAQQIVFGVLIVAAAAATLDRSKLVIIK